MRAVSRSTLAGLALALAACAAGPVTDDAAAIEEIREVTRRWEAALVSGDPAGAVAEVFTTDAIRMPANEPVVRGAQAIAAALEGSVALDEARFDLEDIEVAGDLAYASGGYAVRVPEGQVLAGKFLEVWKRTDAGWRIHRVMWD